VVLNGRQKVPKDVKLSILNIIEASTLKKSVLVKKRDRSSNPIVEKNKFFDQIKIPISFPNSKATIPDSRLT